jgi:Transcriptional regulators
MTTRRGGFLISKVHQASGRIFARMLRDRGMDVHPAHGRVLFVLWQDGPMPIHNLARRVSLTKSTLTNALDRLEASGDVRRVRSSEDRRTIFVELTEKFDQTRQAFEDVSAAMSEKFYRGFTDEETAAFEAMLERILSNVEG